jgi:hypothetical protein
VKKLNVRLGEINTDLSEPIDLFEPSIDEAVEYPEKFLDINDNDIESYRKLKLERERIAASQKKPGMMGGPKK